MRFTVLRIKLFYVRFLTNNIYQPQLENYVPKTRQWEIQNQMFRTPVHCSSRLFRRSKHGLSYQG